MSTPERPSNASTTETLGPSEISSRSSRLMSELRRQRATSKPPRPTVEDVLRAEGLRLEELDHDSLTDLVYTEWTLRVEQGEAPSREEYLTRFPMISHRLEKQWSLEQSLAAILDGDSWSKTIPPAGNPPFDSSSNKITWGPDGKLPERLGKYKVISLLGSGGQGDVFRGLHPELGRDVVLKRVRLSWLPESSLLNPPVQEEQVRAVLDEGRLLAQLSHPNIAQVFDIDQDNGIPFLVMEFVQGKSLDQQHTMKPFTPEQTARIVAKMARAVQAAHDRGILHRDIKPQNIVVDERGEPKLIDFGLARIADVWHAAEQQPGVSGTLGYMSPEQAKGDSTKVGPATDIFGLGAVLYHLLTDQPPYHGSSTITGVSLGGILERVKRCEWDREALSSPNVPPNLAAICSRAMSREPNDRYPSALELAESLEAVVQTQRPTLGRQIALVAVVIAAIAAFGIWSVFFPPRRPDTNSNSAGMVSRPQESLRADLKVFVHEEDAKRELLDVVPLKEGTTLSITSRIPAGFTAMLFSINGQGKLSHIATSPAENTDHLWRYPENASSTVPLLGPTGTECLLIVGSNAPTVAPSEVEAAWNAKPQWPAIPSSTILHLIGHSVAVEQTGRDIGLPEQGKTNPVEVVTLVLEQFATRLGNKWPLVEGIAFRNDGAGE